MIRLEGDRQLPYALADVWTKLRDARFLVQCIQGGQPVGEATEVFARSNVRPNFPFMRGTLEVTLSVIDAATPGQLHIRVVGKGENVGSTADTHLTLTEHQGGTKVHWSVDVTKVEGQLTYVQAAQLQPAALKVTQDMWNMVTRLLPKTA